VFGIAVSVEKEVFFGNPNYRSVPVRRSSKKITSTTLVALAE
jgi:hypothetical protein